MDDLKKIDKKIISIIIVIVLFFMAFLAILVSFLYYRKAINPNPIKIETIADIKDIDREVKINNVIYEDNTKKINSKSVFDTDLKTSEIINNSPKKTLVKKEGKIPLDIDIINSKKLDILRYLYQGDINSAIQLSKNMETQYSFEDETNIKKEYIREFEIFIYEVLQLKNYEKLSYKEKENILYDTISPELILYLYLDLDIKERNNITKNKQSKVITNNNVIPDVNLIYEGNLTAGLYSEMDINNAYFTVPKDIEGFKIKFILNDMKYNLYYIRYKNTNKIEIIYVENLTNYNAPIIKNYE